MSKWISVKEKFPEIDSFVLALNTFTWKKRKTVKLCYFKISKSGHRMFIFGRTIFNHITHWMPLPKVPKDE